MTVTTDFWSIRDNYIALIEQRLPTRLAELAFRRCPRNLSVRDFAIKVGSASLRTFDITRVGNIEDPPFFDPVALERNEDAQVTIAYPVDVALYGKDDLNEIECVIRSDARLMREVIFSAGNYLPGQSLAFPDVKPTDKSADRVWFQDYTVHLIYTEAQTLT